MDSMQELSRQRARLIEQIGELGPMRMGTVTEQMLPTRRADGSIYRRGPYLTYTFRKGGKTCGRHLRNDREADLYRRQIEAFRRYQELSSELVEVSQRLADLEAVGEREGKKNSVLLTNLWVPLHSPGLDLSHCATPAG
jgi:hypothetical protein